MATARGSRSAVCPWSHGPRSGRGFFAHGREGDESDADLMRVFYSPDNFRRKQRLREFAAARDMTIFEAALGWVISQPFSGGRPVRPADRGGSSQLRPRRRPGTGRGRTRLAGSPLRRPALLTVRRGRASGPAARELPGANGAPAVPSGPLHATESAWRPRFRSVESEQRVSGNARSQDAPSLPGHGRPERNGSGTVARLLHPMGSDGARCLRSGLREVPERWPSSYRPHYSAHMPGADCGVSGGPVGNALPKGRDRSYTRRTRRGGAGCTPTSCGGSSPSSRSWPWWGSSSSCSCTSPPATRPRSSPATTRARRTSRRFARASGSTSPSTCSSRAGSGSSPKATSGSRSSPTSR